MNGGTISGKSDGGVKTGNGVFTMKGGSITGNSSTGVNIMGSSIFNMENGVISGNVFPKEGGGSEGGGGVRVEGTFNMKGGEIKENISKSYGGGVLLWYGVFNMSGGKIFNNKANGSVSQGGGVYCNEVFHMTGGEISGNEATVSGGGVYFWYYDHNTSHIFTKTGPSVIAGQNGPNANRVTNDGTTRKGHAVIGLFGERKRDSTAGSGVNLNSRIIGPAGGWDD
jgi:hypothetical protein